MERAELEAEPVAELLRAALGDARELVKLEVELATVEARLQVSSALLAVVAFGVAALAAIVALALFAVSLVLALGATAPIAAAVGGGFVALAGAAALFGYRALPEGLLSSTRARVRSDVQLIKENLA